MTTLFSIAGEHQEDPNRLLLLGDDGQYYQYDPVSDATVPVKPSSGWNIDPNPPSLEEVNG